MSQTSVLKILKKERVNGNNDYFDMHKLRCLLKDKGIKLSRATLYYNIMRLIDNGFLEVNGKWPRKFRFKKI